MKIRLSTIMSALVMLLIFNPNAAVANPIAVNTAQDWTSFIFGGTGSTVSDYWVINSSSNLDVDIVDGYLLGDRFELFLNGQSLGLTSVPGAGAGGAGSGDDAWVADGYSRGTFSVSNGNLTILMNDSPHGNGAAFIRFRVGASRIFDMLSMVSAPEFVVRDGIASCSSGKYRMSSGSEVNINSIVYTLVINNQAVSRIAYDTAGAVVPHMFSPIAQTVSGAVSKDVAIWDVSKLSNFDARCEVTVIKFGTSFNAQSNEFTDAVKTAEIAAKAQAWEDQRSTATAANFTKEAREARKRAAARAVNG